MVKRESVFSNYIFHFSSTIINFLFPLITAYLLLDRLSTEKYGLFAYMLDLSSYFLGLAKLGIPLLGLRELPKFVKNGKQLTDNFTKMQLAIVFNMIFGVSVYILFSFVFNDTFIKDRQLYLLFILYIVVGVFDLEWFFQAIREYKVNTFAAVVQKIALLVGIFVFVHEPKDIYIYFYIFISSQVLRCALFALQLNKTIDLKISYLYGTLKYYKGMFRTTIILYLSLLAQSIFLTFDVLMLGWYLDNEQIAYYSVCVRVIRAVKSIMLVIVPIMLSYHSEEKTKKVNYNTMQITFSIMNMIALPTCVGGIILSKDILGIFLDVVPQNANVGFTILLFIPIIKSYSEFVLSQILLPQGLDKFFSFVCIFAAIFNILTNLFFIPWLGIVGAAITSLATECLILILCMGKYKQKFIEYIRLKISLKYVAASVLMGLAMWAVRYKLIHNSFTTIQVCIAIILGGALYFGLLLLMKDYTVDVFVTYIKERTFQGKAILKKVKI